MKITNQHNIPDEIVKAITSDKYYGGSGESRDYSVTGLLSTPRIFYLTKRHYDEITDDVSNRLWAFFGSIAHSIIESVQEENPNNLAEQRFSYTTSTGKVVTGGIDSYNRLTKTISDFKFTSVYTWIYRNRNSSRLDDYTKQLNMYRFLMERAKFAVDKLKIHMIFRDYSSSKAKFERNYPKPVETIDIPVWGLDVVEAFIEERVNEFEQYKHTDDNDLPICSPEDRWQTQSTWAVTKKGNKKASKVLFSQQAAKEWIINEAKTQAQKKGLVGDDFEREYEKNYALYKIEKRQGENIRCDSYCPCSQFCNFHNSIQR